MPDDRADDRADARSIGADAAARSASTTHRPIGARRRRRRRRLPSTPRRRSSRSTPTTCPTRCTSPASLEATAAGRPSSSRTTPPATRRREADRDLRRGMDPRIRARRIADRRGRGPPAADLGRRRRRRGAAGRRLPSPWSPRRVRRARRVRCRARCTPTRTCLQEVVDASTGDAGAAGRHRRRPSAAGADAVGRAGQGHHRLPAHGRASTSASGSPWPRSRAATASSA